MSRQVKVLAEESLADFLEYEVVDLDYRGIRILVWGNADDSLTVRLENPNLQEGNERALMLHRSRAAMEATLTKVLEAIRKVKAREGEPEYVNWTSVQSDDGA
jgi:hypothetical protein